MLQKLLQWMNTHPATALATFLLLFLPAPIAIFFRYKRERWMDILHEGRITERDNPKAFRIQLTLFGIVLIASVTAFLVLVVIALSSEL